MVIIDQLFFNHAESFGKTILSQVNSQDRNKALYLLGQFQEKINRWGRVVDNELLPEVFAFSLIRNDPEVTTSIPEEIWKQVDELFNNLLDDLITDGLAKKISTDQLTKV